MTLANATIISSPTIGGRVILRCYGNTGQIQVPKGAANSDLSPSSNEAITGASIVGLSWSLVGNSAVVSRAVSDAANNLVVMAAGIGNWNASMGWRGTGEFPTANLIVTFTTGTVGTVFIEISKRYALDPGAES
jgi:hypothetical protein